MVSINGCFLNSSETRNSRAYGRNWPTQRKAGNPAPVHVSDSMRDGSVRLGLAMENVIKLSSPATREFWKINVLFEDEFLQALDKPSGLLTSPDRYDPNRP